MDSNRILVIGDCFRDLDLTCKIMEHIRTEPGNIVIIVPATEEDQEMKTVLLGSSMVFAMRRISEALQTIQLEEYHRTGTLISAIRGTASQDMQRIREHHRHHRRSSILAGHSIPARLKVPRGINRDGHGRPQKKLTPLRAKRRNGSRK